MPEEEQTHPECPECWSLVDEDGDCIEQCKWGPTKCETCGACECDGSC